MASRIDAHLLHPFRLAPCRTHAFDHGAEVIGAEHKSRLLVLHQLRNGSNPRGNRRNAARSSLQKSHAERLVPAARKNQKTSGLDLRPCVVAAYLTEKLCIEGGGTDQFSRFLP